MTDCPLIDYCGITPSKEFYLHRCRGGHFADCGSYREARRVSDTLYEIERDNEKIGRLEDVDEMVTGHGLFTRGC